VANITMDTRPPQPREETPEERAAAEELQERWRAWHKDDDEDSEVFIEFLGFVAFVLAFLPLTGAGVN
jgi:hypothetical protein